ncbi:beta-ketoacyl-ACP synthase II [Spirochaeta isovalerica]|uniref:3-oxoacyl-[acyl-carrier-protein] synthase 2 n=1 Tax=Spirochaeta isovalerica TaxID=150 RepID=A0A841RAT5_9SPIO|nr:beta-ketoacyl-ACP synthase II [Spirochaeta isovalerica]MBB6479542.1 3-oxoacyl-[acyl-carrier-protein] synthase II [Spirochaeta isovalerica]
MSARRRVVITGMGTVNPIAHNVNDTWKGLMEGKSGIGELTRFPAEEYGARIVGEVKDFNASDYIDSKSARKMALFTQFAVVSADQAMKQAGLLKEGAFDPWRAGVILGNGIGGFEVVEEQLENIIERGPSKVAPMTVPKMITNEGAGNIAIEYGLKGPCYVLATACASGTDAIGASLNAIRNNQADVIVTGGTEAAITKLAAAGFHKIHALSTRNDEPLKACRPFDKDRDGFILGEGAGVLILEELEHARKRGANILAEVTGYGVTCDAGHITAPDPDGAGMIRCMQMALEDAGIKPEEVDYINAHGTSTPTNDPIETKAIKGAFGDHAYKLKVSSTKSLTSHLVGAAGGLEAIISVLAIQNNIFPATYNLDNPDPECDLDYVPNKPVEGKIDTVLSDSLGFGGHNGALIIQRYKD